jgi:two-component system OmpR family sensor kinase
VFERFFRGGAARERRVRGSGIGLSLVLNIAEAHRGRVRCDETPGGGATFVVELPL